MAGAGLEAEEEALKRLLQGITFFSSCEI
jgi:hypothetical protein